MIIVKLYGYRSRKCDAHVYSESEPQTTQCHVSQNIIGSANDDDDDDDDDQIEVIEFCAIDNA